MINDKKQAKPALSALLFSVSMFGGWFDSSTSIGYSEV